jgi:hypothetical protein
MNAVVSPSAGRGGNESGMTYATGLVSVGAEIFAGRLALTALGFLVFAAMTEQDVKGEMRRRKKIICGCRARG